MVGVLWMITNWVLRGWCFVFERLQVMGGSVDLICLGFGLRFGFGLF